MYIDELNLHGPGVVEMTTLRPMTLVRVSAVLHVMKVPLEGKTPNFGRISPDDVAELHGPL
jgi:hypothetical protein